MEELEGKAGPGVWIWPLVLLGALALGMVTAILVVQADIGAGSVRVVQAGNDVGRVGAGEEGEHGEADGGSNPFTWGREHLAEIDRDLSLRFPWAVSTGVFLAALMCASGLALTTLWSYAQDAPPLRLAGLLCSVAVGTLFWPWREKQAGFLGELLETLGPDRGPITALVGIARILFAVAPAMIVLLGFTFASIARRATHDDSPNTLGACLTRFHSLLYLVGLALVAGVLCSILRLRLQIDPAFAGADLAHANSLASSVSLSYGATATVLLLALFAPTHIALRTRARAAARQALPKADTQARKAWMRENALDDGPLVVLLRGLAVLAPLLAALVERGLDLALV